MLVVPNIKLNKSWLNWFEITKLVSCIVGIYIIEFYSSLTNIILIINILEAVIKDKFIINSLFGVYVAFSVNVHSIHMDMYV
jgi:hypothetical protein